ncbi:MAG: hypothetical protein KF764_21330 [Labilithrix sp.]|nr:hypothetical protein [Labilithrix sp.]MBX3223080.1 hypothetical protein [Labilithrix sp.]
MKLRVSVALFALIAFTAVSAGAQMSEGEKKAAARAAYMEGVALQDKGNPADALGRFEAAQKLFDAPTHLLHIAQCQALTGKLVEASETYETLTRKTLEKNAPEVFVQAQEQAKAELTPLRQRIPTMRVTVKPEAQSLQDLQVTINDKQMPGELLGIARPVNPGTYKLTASATGWGTPAPVEVEVKEKEPRSVELVLQQGAGGVVVADGGGTPAPYEQPKPKPSPESPSSTGLLVGLRPGLFVPVGDVAKGVKFDNYAKAGPGAGLDVIGRVARIFLVGGTLEYASLGAPDPSVFPVGSKAEVGTHSIYAGVLAGIMPNVDRVTFVADAGAGMRFLSRSLTLTSSTGEVSTGDETYSGLELAVNAGVSIPAGPLRIVPKAGLAFGQFTDRNCGVSASTSPTLTGCGTNAEVTTASHAILNLAVGVYYHVDFAKKAGSASSSPFFTTASAR